MTVTSTPFEVDERTRSIDTALFEIERDIDWLNRVSPLDNPQRWARFEDSGHTEIPQLTYPEFDLDLDAVSARLDALDVEAVDQPVIGMLLQAKKVELQGFVELLAARDTPTFAMLSVSLFGGNDPALIADAREILENVPASGSDGDEGDDGLAGADDVVAEARAARERYASIRPDFHFEIEIVDDADAILMVDHGDLVVDRHLRIPRSRVVPLVAHEVGVHVLTRYNGARQPLRLFESGFADYDVLQEGLATFCEYLAGSLPPARLRVLAARVIAADLAVGQHSVDEIFRALHDDCGVATRAAFEVAVRAKRGGGLTKDAVYLAGLRDVHAWLASGGDIEELFVGKFSLHQRHLIAELLDEGILVPPALLPACVVDDAAADRLAEAVATPFTSLYHPETTS